MDRWWYPFIGTLLRLKVVTVRDQIEADAWETSMILLYREVAR